MYNKPLLFLLSFLFVATGFAQMGIGTASPDSSAMLDVYSQTKGFLPPRIALSATNLAEPVTKPATGLLIYNTATAGTGATRVMPGYYYWNGAGWQAVANRGAAAGDMQYWNGNQWVSIPAGANGSVLTLCNGVPRWGGCPDSIVVLQPANNPNEAYVYSYFPNDAGIGTTNIPVMEWTHNGTPATARGLIKFDHSIPAGATIISAKLSLYAATPSPNSGNLQDAHHGTNNAMYIQRVTSNWTGNTATWNNQPTTSTLQQITVPHTNSPAQDDIDIDVTQLVKDMQQYGNYGFMLRLATTNFYNSRQYMSSYSSNPARYPRLVITFKP